MIVPQLSVVKHELPAYWASYLINGDNSGLELSEKEAADAYLAKEGLNWPVTCEPAGIGRFNGLQCDLETYSFLV